MFGNNNCWWIIIIVLLLVCCCGQENREFDHRHCGHPGCFGHHCGCE